MTEFKIITTETHLEKLLFYTKTLKRKNIYSNLNEYHLKQTKTFPGDLLSKLQNIAYQPIKLSVPFYDYYLDKILKAFLEKEFNQKIDSLICQKEDNCYVLIPQIKKPLDFRSADLSDENKKIHFFTPLNEPDFTQLIPLFQRSTALQLLQKKLSTETIQNLQNYQLLSDQNLALFYADKLEIHHKIWNNLLLIKTNQQCYQLIKNQQVHANEWYSKYPQTDLFLLEQFVFSIKEKKEQHYQVYTYTDENKHVWQELSVLFDLFVEFKHYQVAVRNDLRLDLPALIDEISSGQPVFVAVQIKPLYSEHFQDSFVLNQIRLRYLTVFLFLTSNYDLENYLDDIIYGVDLSVQVPLFSRQQLNKLLQFKSEHQEKILENSKILTLNQLYPTKEFLEKYQGMIINFQEQDYLVGRWPDQFKVPLNSDVFTDQTELKWLQTRMVIVQPLIEGKIKKEKSTVTIETKQDIKRVDLAETNQSEKYISDETNQSKTQFSDETNQSEDLQTSWSQGQFLTDWAKYYYHKTKQLPKNFWLKN